MELSSYELIVLKGLVEDQLKRADNQIGHIYNLLRIRETLLNVNNNKVEKIDITYCSDD